MIGDAARATPHRRAVRESGAPARLLHIITGLGTGGAEASLLRVLAAQQDPSEHVVVSLTDRGTHGDRLEQRGVSVFALGLPRGALAPQALLPLHALVRRIRPTATQGWMYHANLAASVLSLSGAPTGPVFWNVRHALDAWDHERRTLRSLIQLSAWLSWHPTRIVYNSHRSAEQHVAKGYRASRTLVIPNSVDATRFSPQLSTRAAMRQRLGIAPDTPLIGHVARVDPLKDHATFVRAVTRHSLMNEQVHYVMAGHGTESGANADGLGALVRDAIAASPSLAGRLHRLGVCGDVPALMNACDLVTMTSRSEGSPNVIAEAMACGVPCVVTNVGDAARLVGETGVVVRVGDDHAIADVWERLATRATVRRALGAAAMQRIHARYSVAAETSAYADIWGLHPQVTRVSSGSVSAPRALFVTTVSTTLSAFLTPFAAYFRARGWHVDAMAAGAPQQPALVDSFNRVHEAPWTRSVAGAAGTLVMMVRSLRAVREVIRTGQYDVVHVHTPIAAFLSRLALRGKHGGGVRAPRVIYTAHGFHAHPTGFPIANALFRLAERVASRWTDYLVVINAHDAALARRDGLAAPGFLIEHAGIGVDLGTYRPRTSVERSSVRAMLGLTAHQPVLAVVAEFNRNKRQRDVVAALARLRDEATGPLPVILFVGDGQTRPAVAARARRLGVESHVRFLGQRNDVAQIVGACDALVLASKREGLPRCLLEAMALGVPAVASTARGSVDLLRDARGWLFPVGDVNALAECIRIVLSDSTVARARATRASTWIAKHASFERIAERHATLYAAALRSERVTEPDHRAEGVCRTSDRHPLETAA